MRIAIISILFLFIFIPLKAQFHQGLYTFKNLPLNRLYNPSAEIINNKELLFPVVSHIQSEQELYGFTVQEIFSNKTANKTIENFIATKNSNEHIWADEMINLFYYGFKDKSSDKFWSFGVYHETQGYIFYPADIIDLMYNGNKIDQVYDIGDIRAQATSLTVYHAGITIEPKNKPYSFGGRLKLYNSIASVDAVRNRGTITTKQNTNTNQVAILLDGKVRLNSSGLSSNNNIGQIVKNSMFSGNFGLGIDIGATYHFDKNWSTSASIIDLGAIYNSSDISNYQVTGSHTFEGLKIYDSSNTNIDFWQEMKDRFKEGIKGGDNKNNYFLTMPTKIIASVTYTKKGRRVVRNNDNCCCKNNKSRTAKHYFTFTSYNKLLHNYWDWALGVSYTGELNSRLAVQTNYMYSPYDATNIGAGLSLRLDPVLIYFSVDNIPGMFNLNQANSSGGFVGVNFVF